MKSKSIIVPALLAVCPLLAFGQLPQPAAVGFTTASLLGESDSAISLPFVRPPVFTGTIQSATGNTITVNGGPWTANQLVYTPGSQPNHYYALIGAAPSANSREGHTYPITANGTNTLTVELGEDSLVVEPGLVEPGRHQARRASSSNSTGMSSRTG